MPGLPRQSAVHTTRSDARVSLLKCRSHDPQVSVRQQSRVRDIHESVKVGRLYMIDLAGSERAKRTKVGAQL